MIGIIGAMSVEVEDLIGIMTDETAETVCSKEELLEMRKTAKEILVATEVFEYAMKLSLATHPSSETATSVSKRYVRYGASPRSAQALISTAKVRALMNGRYNVSYEDINALALPVLRHRIKLNFEAITENITADEVINQIIKEIGGKAPAKTEPILDASAETPNPKKGLFDRKK
jgi:MoxR-like ATPase